MPLVRRAADRARAGIGVGVVCLSQAANAQADVGQLSGLVNFLDAGLTTLGAASAFATTLARGVLSVETAQREYVFTEDLFRRYHDQHTNPHCPKNSPGNLIDFGVLTSIENIAIAQKVVTEVTRATGVRGEVVPVETVAGLNCVKCLLLASDSQLVAKLTASATWNHRVSSPAAPPPVGAVSYTRLCCAQPANAGNAVCASAIAFSPAENTTTDHWHAPVSFLVVNRCNWLPNQGDLLLLPYTSRVAESMDDAVMEGCASRDEDQRGELQPLLRTLAASSTRPTQTRNTADLTTSAHYMGVLELVLACALAILFRVDTLSSFLAGRRVVSSFMTGRSGRSLHWGWFLSRVERVAWWDVTDATDPNHVLMARGNAYSLKPLEGLPACIKRCRPYLVLLATLGAFGGWAATVLKHSHWQVSGNYQLVYQLSTVIGYSVLLLLGICAAGFDAAQPSTKVFEFGATDRNYAAGAGSCLARFRICLESVIDSNIHDKAKQNKRKAQLERALTGLVRYALYFGWVLLLGGAIALVVCSRCAAEGVGRRGREAMVGAAYVLASLVAWWVWFVAASAREAELRLRTTVTAPGTAFFALPFLYIAVMASVSGPWRGK